MVYLLLLEHTVLSFMYVVYNYLPDYPPALAKNRAKLQWRKRVTVEVFKAQGKPIVVDGSGLLPSDQPLEWSDDIIPERFWHDATGYWVAPRQVREWVRMVKAGEWIAAQEATARATDRTRAELSEKWADAMADAAAKDARASGAASAREAYLAKAQASASTATTAEDSLTERGSDLRTPKGRRKQLSLAHSPSNYLSYLPSAAPLPSPLDV